MKSKRLLFGLAAVLILNMFTYTASANDVDNSSPTLIYSEPLSGEEIPVDRIMCIVFSENIYKGASFSKITLKDYSGRIIPADIEIEKDMLVITPKGYLSYDCHYVLTLPVRAVKNKPGNSLRSTITLKFKTEAEFGDIKLQAETRVFEPDKIYAKASPAVVSIETKDSNGLLLNQGSGFFVSEDGKILTNHHVVCEGSSVTIKCPNGKLYNNAKILLADISRDLAVLKIDDGKVSYIELGDPHSIVTGQKVAVIGSPEGLENTISDGIISNRLRVLDGLNYLQTNAAVSHGSSGGPLLDLNARAIGIMVYSLNKDEAQNLNPAIPVSDIRQILDKLQEADSSATNTVLKPIEPKEEYLRFFESGYNPPERGERTYNTEFFRSSTRYINWELGITYNAAAEKQNLKVRQRFLKPDGSILGSVNNSV